MKVFTHNCLACKIHGISREGCSDGRGEEVALKEVGDDATPAEPAGVEAEDVSVEASEAEGISLVLVFHEIQPGLKMTTTTNFNHATSHC